MTELKMDLLNNNPRGYKKIDESSSPRPRLESDVIKRVKTDYTCEFACKFHDLSEEEIAKTQKAKRQLLCASAFCFIFMVVELIGGYIANSLALMSDATHLLSDFAGLMISITALWLTQRQSDTSKHSYGFHRAEIIGAMFSIFLIWGLTVWLIYEAIMRLITPEKIDGKTMFIVACLGILVNVVMGAILFQGGHHSHGLGGGGHDHSHGHEHNENDNHNNNHSHNDDNNHNIDIDDHEDHDEDKNINVRSAFVHVLGDLVQSVGVMIAGAFIWYDHATFRFMDPVCTLIFSIIVIFTTVSIMKDALAILMENVPKNIQMGLLNERLRNLPDVADLHDLHVWNLTVGKPALSVHLLAKSSTLDKNGKIVPACVDGILRQAQKLVAQDFGIEHSTIQIEWPREIHSSHVNLDCPEYCKESENEMIEYNNDNDDNHNHKHDNHNHNHNHDHNHKYDDNDRDKDKRDNHDLSNHSKKHKHSQHNHTHQDNNHNHNHNHSNHNYHQHNNHDSHKSQDNL